MYHVGEHDTYFIPVYTAGAGGVVAQLGTIAAVGAAFTGEYHVGLGQTQEEAFQAYLQKLSGVKKTSQTPIEGEAITLERSDRIEFIKSIFTGEDIEIVEPTSIQIPISFKEGEIFFFTDEEQEDTEKLVKDFIDDYVKPRSDRIFMWEENNIINFGTVLIRENVAEMHYISIEVGS